LPTWLQPDFVTRQDLQARWQRGLAQISPQRQRQEMLTAPLWSFIFAASDPGVTSFPLRVRFPFFDLRLLQYLSSVPPMPWFERKNLLRVAMRERLPQIVLQRPKTTLGGNLHTLLQQQGVQPWMPELLSTPALVKYVDKAAWLHAASEGTPSAYVQSGPLFTFAYWFRHKYQSPPLGADSAL
jgi:asparagine synthase (glutamine-hydrolysing)